MNPMSTFDPDVACRVHDKVNEQVLIWKPEWADELSPVWRGSMTLALSVGTAFCWMGGRQRSVNYDASAFRTGSLLGTEERRQ
jgi:hypothetical protein